MRASLCKLSAVATICGVLSTPAIASPLDMFHGVFRRTMDTFSTTPSDPLQERQVVNCSDTSNFYQACWKQMGLTDWLLNPQTGWNATMPTCSNTTQNDLSNGTSESSAMTEIYKDSKSACCHEGELWMVCFLRLALGPGQDCSTINSGSCSWTANPRLKVHADSYVKVLYVLRNIFVVNDFFSTYYQALDGSTGTASLAINSIVNEFDPVAPKDSFGLLDVLSVLALGLAFLGAPTIAVGIITSEVTLGVKLAAQGFLISLMQTPSFIKAMLPSGTLDTKFIQIGQLQTDLGGTVKQLGKMINNGVGLLATDMPTFVNFVNSGQYSSVNSYSIPNETTGLEIALTTYLASSAMAGNGWWASVTVGPMTKDDMTSTMGCTFQDNDVCLTSSDSGDGAAYYLSPDTGRMFTLLHTTGYTDKSSYQVLQDLVNNQWAPLNVLFDGSYNCTARGDSSVNDIQFTFNGTLNVACISRLPIMAGGCANGHKIAISPGGGPGPVICPCPYVNSSCPFTVPDGIMGCD